MAVLCSMSEIFNSDSVILTSDHKLLVLTISYSNHILSSFSPLIVTYLFLNRLDVIRYHFPTLLWKSSSPLTTDTLTPTQPNLNLQSVTVALTFSVHCSRKRPSLAMWRHYLPTVSNLAWALTGPC